MPAVMVLRDHFHWFGEQKDVSERVPPPWTPRHPGRLLPARGLTCQRARDGARNRDASSRTRASLEKNTRADEWTLELGVRLETLLERTVRHLQQVSRRGDDRRGDTWGGPAFVARGVRVGQIPTNQQPNMMLVHASSAKIGDSGRTRIPTYLCSRRANRRANSTEACGCGPPPPCGTYPQPRSGSLPWMSPGGRDFRRVRTPGRPVIVALDNPIELS